MTKSNLITGIKLLALGITVGILAGAAVAAFLICLNLITALRDGHTWLIFLLPLAGLLTGLLYWHFGKEQVLGHGLILEEIHQPRSVLPIRIAPLVFFSTLLTHLGGGSAGREGTAVQVGASLSDQLSHFFPFAAQERTSLLKAGMAAGFSAAIGAPFAGTLFGIEVSPPFRFKPRDLLLSATASVVAFETCSLLGAPHTKYPRVTSINYSWKLFLWLFFASVAFGLLVRLFVATTHFIEISFSKYVRV
ncbi:MAG: chloride channel protein, partial [Bdellovibrionota bacterium]